MSQHLEGGPAAAVRVAPLSPGQERLLAAEHMTADLSAAAGDSNLRPIDTGAVLVHGELGVASIERAVAALTARQEALRTTFRFPGGGPPVQVVLPPRPRRLEVRDLVDEGSGLPPMESIAVAARREAPRPDAVDLFRVSVFRLGADRHVVLLQVHHLVSDGWSIGLLYRELSELYACEVTARRSRLPRLTLSFGEYCTWMRARRSGGELEGQLRYWRAELAGPRPAIRWPGAPKGAGERVRPVADESLVVRRDEVERLRAVSAGARIRGGLAGPMLAALFTVVHLRTGATDLRVGTMVAARTRDDTEHVIGNFVNTVAIRVQLAGDELLTDLVARVNAKVAAALDHQDVPIQDVGASLPSSSDDEPLYQVTFALNTMKEGSLDLPGATCEDFGLSASNESTGPRVAPGNVDLRWLLVDSGGELRGSITYAMERFSRATARAYADDFGRALRAMSMPAATVTTALEA